MPQYKLPEQSLVSVYAVLILKIKWSTSSLLTNLTPKLSTTSVKVRGQDLCHYRPRCIDVGTLGHFSWRGLVDIIVWSGLMVHRDGRIPG